MRNDFLGQDEGTEHGVREPSRSGTHVTIPNPGEKKKVGGGSAGEGKGFDRDGRGVLGSRELEIGLDGLGKQGREREPREERDEKPDWNAEVSTASSGDGRVGRALTPGEVEVARIGVVEAEDGQRLRLAVEVVDDRFLPQRCDPEGRRAASKELLSMRRHRRFGDVLVGHAEGRERGREGGSGRGRSYEGDRRWGGRTEAGGGGGRER